MIILGIDPGTATTGFGFLRVEKDNSLQVVKYGLIETDKDEGPHGKRFISIHSNLTELIGTYKPNVLAIERVFFARNAKTAIRVGQAIGVMLHAAALAKLPAYEYAPGRIKKLISGNGRSNKEEMQAAVRKYLGPSIRKKKGEKTHFDNAADALAVALCHIKETTDII